MTRKPRYKEAGKTVGLRLAPEELRLVRYLADECYDGVISEAIRGLMYQSSVWERLVKENLENLSTPEMMEIIMKHQSQTDALWRLLREHVVRVQARGVVTRKR